MTDGDTGLEIAIIGMACRVPDAPDVETFWHNVCAGHVAIRELSEAELLASGVPRSLLADPAYVRAAAVVDGEDLFDAAYFGYNPREAQLLDPQHRLFLECAAASLQRAGYDSARYPGRIGLFGSVSVNLYLLRNLWPNAALHEVMGGFPMMLGAEKDYLTTRVAYKLDLRGPAVTVQTACSSSLVAVHLAVQALLGGECDLALAGGVTVRVPQRVGYLANESGILSPDGQCRPYDLDGQGIVTGNGVGVVVLKRLAEAQADGDDITAVILGSAINNDGIAKVGFTAPGHTGQTDVIRAALGVAGLGGPAVGYVEGHGTATPLGDPVEVGALTEAFGGAREAPWCALSSVKANLGHLDTAAGVVGLMKAALAVRDGLVPPHPTFRRPNPNIDFDGSPFFVPTGLRKWPIPGPRRAGVSSFGIGGTNAHVVLAQPPEPAPADIGLAREYLPVSARTPEALSVATRQLADALAARPDLALADVAYTTQVGRGVHEYRRVVLAGDTATAGTALRNGGGVTGSVAGRGSTRVAWLFAGQGSQYVGMGAGLYRDEPVFRRTLDECAEILAGHLDTDLRELLFSSADRSAGDRLRRTEYAQPALFSLGYALARTLRQHGITPDAMLGHSLGEYVAAQQAGVLDLADALSLVAIRGRLTATRPAGAMLAVSLPPDELAPLLPDGSALAAHNGPRLSVASGPVEEMAALAARLVDCDVWHKRLRTSHAFHSAMLDEILPAYRAAVATVPLRAPLTPFVSNVTGTWITDEEATDPDYWTTQLRSPVRFTEGLDTLLRAGVSAFVELGPRPALGALVPRRDPAPVVVSVLDPATAADVDAYGAAVARLWVEGVPVDWRGGRRGEHRRRVPLPTYPFQRRRFWIDPPVEATDGYGVLRLRAWRSVSATPAATSGTAVVCADPPVAKAIESALASRGHRVRHLDPDPDVAAARYAAAVAGWTEPPVVVCARLPLSALETGLGRLADAVTDAALPAARLIVAGDGVLAVESADMTGVDGAALRTAAALVAGGRLRTQVVDLGGVSTADAAAILAREVGGRADTDLVAHRGQRRWAVYHSRPVLGERGDGWLPNGARCLLIGPGDEAALLARALVQILDARVAVTEEARDVALPDSVVLLDGAGPALVAAAGAAFAGLDAVFWLVPEARPGDDGQARPARVVSAVQGMLSALDAAAAEAGIGVRVAHVRRAVGQPDVAGPWESAIEALAPHWVVAGFAAEADGRRRPLLADYLELLARSRPDRISVGPGPNPAAVLPLAAADEPAPADTGDGRRRTPTEAAVGEIWRELLGTTSFGDDDEFFAVGGHSLLLAQLAAVIRSRFGVDVTMRELLAGSTVTAMAARIERGQGPADAVPALMCRPIEPGEPAPLTPAQLNIWFLQHLAPGNLFYTLTNVMRIAGALDVATFGRAWVELVRRHELLRSLFPVRDRRPVQIVQPPEVADLPVFDLSALPRGRREGELVRLSRSVAADVVEIGSRLPARALLLRLAPEEYALCLALHHIVVDYWSVTILLDQLFELYVSGADVPEPAVRYSDYARWENEQRDTDAYREQLAYWTERFATCTPVLELPADHPRPPTATFRGGWQPLAVPREVAARVEAVAREFAATPYMVLLAVFLSQLHALTGETDLSVGSYAAHRPLAELDRVIGLFVRTLALRTDVSGEPTFGEVVRRVRQTCVEAYDNASVSVEEVLRALRLERDGARNPLFQCMLLLETAPAPSPRVPGLDVAVTAVESGTAKLDLLLVLYPAETGLVGFLEYSRDLFEPGTAERLAEQFVEMVARATAEPAAPLAALAQEVPLRPAPDVRKSP
ncbi:condensation domain-containing protein [Plantactinospora sp. DSM 117369]